MKQSHGSRVGSSTVGNGAGSSIGNGAGSKVIVVGSGPNGLVAAVTLARAGCQVTVLEAAEQPGGGLRTEALTLPGFSHDVCSAVHPLAIASPAMQALGLEKYGLRWLHHEVVATHPLDGGTGAVLYQDLALTAAGLGGDGGAYLRLIETMIESWPAVSRFALGPWLAQSAALSTVLSTTHSPALPTVPSTALSTVPATMRSLLRLVPLWAQPAEMAAQYWFKSAPARALLAGCAAHAFQPLHRASTAGFGALLLLMAHQYGWPIAEKGSQSIADALLAALADAGGTIELDHHVSQLSELPHDAVIFLDLTAANATKLLANKHAATRRLASVAPGGACWKIDYALDAPLPWTHAPSRSAGTVHLGGTLEEVAYAERAVSGNTGNTTGGNTGNTGGAAQLPQYPFTLVAQPTLVDPTRAPANKHVAWVYAHVPYRWASDHDSAADATEAIERQLERFAPGFRRHVLSRSVMNTSQLEAHNANYVGGDITGGQLNLAGLLKRQFPSRYLRSPYRLSPGLYLCSSSTPPGPGTHGMAGYHAAHAALGAELKS